jgi:MFS family permease
MMFLQYAVWGVWLPFLARYLTSTSAEGGLGFTPGEMGTILGLAASLGAITAPFIAGQVADRYLNAERALGILLLLGGALNIALAGTTQYPLFLLLGVAYSVCYMPTLSLTNSIAFRNVTRPETQFPPVRAFGTLGWIAAQSLFPLLWLNSSNDVENTRRIADALRVSGIISIGYAFYAFFVLPKTPPKREGHPLAFMQAFGLLKNRAFLVVTLIALPIAMIHQAYFMHVMNYISGPAGFSMKWSGAMISVGQVSEICFLAILGFLIRGIGFKYVFLLGCLAYAGRFAVFAAVPQQWAIVLAQALHGLCYGCLFAGAFILVAKLAPAEIEHSAQTVFGIIILGLGPILAVFYNQFVSEQYGLVGPSTAFDVYGKFWWTQAGIAAAVAVFVLIAFPSRVDVREVRE